MIRRRTLLTGLLFGALPGAALAATPFQTAPPTPDPSQPKSAYEKLFPSPTGTNGYEDIVRAGDRLAQAASFDAPPTSGTLAQKRVYLADPACQEALQLLRQGLAKPISLPRAAIDYTTTFPDYAVLRSLARLLGIKIYVDFAYGRNSDAIDGVHDGLLLGHSVKGEAAIGSLVGRAADAIVLRSLMRQRNAWNVRDCERIYSLAMSYLSQPDPAFAAQASEQAIQIRDFSGFKNKPDDILNQIAENAESESDDLTPKKLQARQYVRLLRQDAALRGQVADELPGAVAARYDAMNALLADPTRRMALPPTSPQNSQDAAITAFLVDAIAPDPILIRRYVEARLSFQLLAIHATIVNYRWQNDHLPEQLTILALDPQWIVDPFTGQPLVYKVASSGTDYSLASAGALVAGENGAPDHREPMNLDFAPRKS